MQAKEEWLCRLTDDYYFILIVGESRDVYRDFVLLYKPFGQEEDVINYIEDKRWANAEVFFHIKRQLKSQTMYIA